MIWAQPARDGLRIIDTYRNTGKNIDFYVPIITGQVIGDSKYIYKEAKFLCKNLASYYTNFNIVQILF